MSQPKGDRFEGYLAFADDQSLYYLRALDDITALIERDVLPFVPQAGGPGSLSAAASVATHSLSTIRELLADLQGITRDAQAIAGTLHQDLRLFSVGTHTPPNECYNTQIANALQTVRDHLTEVRRGVPVSNERLADAYEGLQRSTDVVAKAHAETIHKYLSRSASKAAAAAQSSLLNAYAAANAHQNTPLVQLQEEATRNASEIRRLGARAATIAVNIKALSSDTERLRGDLSVLEIARRHIRSQCDAQLERIDASYAAELHRAEAEAAAELAEAQAALGEAMALAQTSEEARTAHAAAHGQLELAIRSESAMLSAELRELQQQIDFVRQYGPYPSRGV